MKKRFLSILLSLCMVLALLPVTAFAEDNEEPTETPVCICEAACAAEAMNADCPVCGAEGATIENCGKYEVPVEETEPEQTAVEKVQAMLDALPTVEELENAEEATVNAAYEAAQAAYDALDVLSPEEQEQITGVEKLVALMDWFNGQVSPLADPTTYQVTTVAGAVTGYDSFSDALAAAQENNGSTLKCFADVNDTDIAINNGNFTIDANGKTFTSAIVVGSGATVTIDGNGIFNRLPVKSIIYVNGTLNIKSGTFYQTYSDGQVVGLVEAGHGGTINIFGGDFNQVRATVNGIITGGSFRLMSVAGGVRISGGKYKRLSVNMGNTNGVSVYLADGYGIKYKGSWADAFATSIGSQSDDDYYVEVVATPFQVTTAAGAVTGYDSFSAALTAAQENNGSTLKCFADVNNGNITITKGNFTIDANGKKFTSNILVNSGAEVTIDGNGTFEPDSHSLSIFSVLGILNIKSGNFYYRNVDDTCNGTITGGNGTLNISGGDFAQVDAIGNGTISGGTFQSMYVAANTKLRGGKYKLLEVDLEVNNLDAYLADGYGIKYKGGWADASVTTIGSTEDADYYVEVAESPIQDFDLQLTETEDGNLTVEVKNQVISDDYLETYPNAPAELRYRYKVDDGGWTGLTDSATYTFAPGSVGKHTISVITRLAFNNCEKSLDYYVIGYQSEDGAGTVASGVKFDGVDYILSEDTFTRDGFVQIGWQDEQGNVYDLGETYTADAGATMSPVWEEKITVEVPFTTTVDLGDNTEPGEKTFALELVSSKAGGDWEPNVTIEGSVTTDGAGNYSGKLKFTGLYDEIRRLLCESALVRQVNDGAENWTYDDTVYALVMMDDVNYASDMIYEPDVPTFHIDIYPTTEVEPGYYEFEWYGETLEEMSFKNTYTLHTHDYAQKFDADGHWDECPCGDKQNSETHKFGDWMETQAPTHTAKGEKERVCSVCNYVETAEVDEIAHAYNLNHDADGHWEECACGDKQNSETHKYGEWKVTKAATTSAKGEKEHVCSVCQYTETAEIPMLEKNEPTKTDSPQTGDNSNMALWFALILLSGGALAGTAVYGKKRKHSAK